MFSYPITGFFCVKRRNILVNVNTVKLARSTVKPPNSEHTKQRTCLEQRTKYFVPNVTISVKLPLNSGHLLITDKFFKTRSCVIFRGLTVHIILQKYKTTKISKLQRRVKEPVVHICDGVFHDNNQQPEASDFCHKFLHSTCRRSPRSGSEQ